MIAVVGVDGGGTKTDAALAAADGRVLARARGGPSNWQAVGRAAAGGVYRELVGGLVARAAAEGLSVRAVAWGLSGLDRPRDEEVLAAVTAPLVPDGAASVLVNDTFLILRAGSADGAGVAVVSGTGSNCVGVGPAGRRERIGGLGGPFGDGGSAGDIGREALRAAFRGQDGRGPRTALTALILERFGLARLDDIVDFFIADAEDAPDEGLLAPLAFEAAAAGDPVATGLLEAAGRELGLCARLVAARLFPADAGFPLVMGGSVLQKAALDVMRDALVAEARGAFPRLAPVVLDAPPLLGAALLALDEAARREGGAGVAGPEVARRLAAQLRDAEEEAR